MAKIRELWRVTSARDIDNWLPERDPNGHKGDFGKLLLVCGAVGYAGAPMLAARAALRTGAGLVYLGVPQSIYPIVAGAVAEAVVFPLPDRDGMLDLAALPLLKERLCDCDACLIGCGLGRSESVTRLVAALLSESRCPTVVDADGINALQGHIDILRGTSCPVILTPHDGEFRRLGGQPDGDRRAEVVRFVRQTGTTLLLKGHRTLICGSGEHYVNRTGNAGMATGGSGDALAGIMTALLGLGLPPVRAAAAAAWLHGAAGDLCARELGQYAMLPSDLIERLPRLLK